MAHKPVCLVCQKEMELGFMTELGHAQAVHLPRWCAGTPDKGFWTIGDAKHAQREAGAPVTAYRCPECKALRLYAFDPE